MKNMFENGETFKAYTMIDYCYFCIEKIYENYKIPRTGIVAEIDRVTGYDLHRNNEAKEATISMLKVIIKNKKAVDADYSPDEKFLLELQKIK